MSDLLNDVRQLLKERPAHLSYRDIADATQLTEAWLKKFATNETLDPRISHVQKLYNYLKAL